MPLIFSQPTTRSRTMTDPRPPMMRMEMQLRRDHIEEMGDLTNLSAYDMMMSEVRDMPDTKLPDNRGKRRCSCGRPKAPELWSCWTCYDKEQEQRAQIDPVLREHLHLMKKFHA